MNARHALDALSDDEWTQLVSQSCALPSPTAPAKSLDEQADDYQREAIATAQSEAAQAAITESLSRRG